MLIVELLVVALFVTAGADVDGDSGTDLATGSSLVVSGVMANVVCAVLCEKWQSKTKKREWKKILQYLGRHSLQT